MAAAADWLPYDLFGLILRLNMDALSGVDTAYYYYYYQSHFGGV